MMQRRGFVPRKDSRSDSDWVPVCAGGEDGDCAGVLGGRCQPDWSGSGVAAPACENRSALIKFAVKPRTWCDARPGRRQRASSSRRILAISGWCT